MQPMPLAIAQPESTSATGVRGTSRGVCPPKGVILVQQVESCAAGRSRAKRSVRSFGPVILLSFLVGAGPDAPGGEPPTSDRRILYNSDASNALAEHWMWSAHLGTMDAQEKKALIEDSIDEIAAAGIDTLSVVCWEKFMPDLARSQVCPDDHRLKRLQYFSMVEADLTPIDIMIERCQKNGIEFIATLRMNDRHESTPAAAFIKEHPEWKLSRLEMNYEHAGVRAKVLEFIRELLDSHQVDGIQFDYMRFCHVFEAGEGEQHADLLTDFTKQARALLDAAAERRGRSRLMLGVRVPQTLQECKFLGYDVAAWIQEGLVDWVVPSDFFYTDLNTRIEDFAALAEGTSCKIYGAIHPLTCSGDDVGMNRIEHYRAAAQNFYTAGAAGLEAYNYQYHWGRRTGRTTPWSATQWPAALGILGKLADPSEITKHDRHYRFFRLWPSAPTSPAPGANKDDRIKLARSEPNPVGSRTFRLAEDPNSSMLRTILQFKAVGLEDGESLLIELNGTTIADRWIIRKAFKQGRSGSQGRPLEKFYEYTIDLGRGPQRAPLVNGDNQLVVSLRNHRDGADGIVSIDELEAYVYVRQSR